MQLKRYLLVLILLLNFVPLSFAQDARPIVRLIYFLPSDREPQPDIDEKMDRLIKDAQQFYADQMEAHGFGRKTFLFETDANGKAVVHRMIGQHTDKYYNDLSYSWDIWEEIDDQFDTSRNYYLTAIDISSEKLDRGSACGRGGGWEIAGSVLIPASGGCFNNFKVAAHELGHAFGLGHDFRDGAYIMSYGPGQARISKCTAEWLDVHRAFNTAQPTANVHTKVEMLPPSLVAPSSAIRLRFKVSDPDGLHQVQLLTPTLTGLAQGFNELLSCKTLYGSTSTIVEFVTIDLTPKNRYVSLQVMDINGNFGWSKSYPIDVSALLLPPEVVSIPDPHLAAAVRRSLDLALAPNDAITTHTMQYLRTLTARNSGITDLTGLEHARNLTSLNLGGEYIDGKGFVNSNTVSDFSPLAELTQLTELELAVSNITDVSPLAELTQLTELKLAANNITDVAPLAGLTQLTKLYLGGNNITDVSPLAELIQLTELYLSGNNITDVSPLAELIQLTRLYLLDNNITDVSPLAGLTQLRWLYLSDNNITDVDPLAKLTQLEYLSLSDNNIADVAPLAGLIQLTGLYLGGNNITDVDPLAGLTQLRWLSLWNNNITDVAPLAELTQLEYLSLSDNNIADVAPLVRLNLTGTERDIELDLRNNPLSYASINTHIPAIQAKGFEVEFDNIAYPVLQKISGDNQEAFAGKVLSSPLVVEVVDEKGEPLQGVSVTFTVSAGSGKLTDTTTTTDADGYAQTTLTLGWTLGINTVRVSAEGIKSEAIFNATVILPENHVAADVNADAVVDIEDLVLVAATIGMTPPEGILPNTDVNGDGTVNEADIALVLAALESAPASPAAVLTAANLQRWIDKAKQQNINDPTFRQGIAVLEQLLATLQPKATALLANYPNPFNPETWIPYHLAQPAEVTLHIYAINGALVRTLILGHQPAGIYEHRSRAAYWDGRNEEGERVASGVYFYTLTTGEFTATRKMLIWK